MRIIFNVDEEINERLVKVSKNHGLSKSAFLRLIISKELKKEGYLGGEKSEK